MQKPELPLHHYNIPDTMKMAVMPRVGDMHLETVSTVARLRMEQDQQSFEESDDIIVRIRHIGICGSDLHYYEDGKCGSFVIQKFPFVLGHECAGVVVAVGKRAQSQFNIGDKVALEPGIPCQRCEHCRTGMYNLCADIQFMATPPYDGCMQEFVRHPAMFAFKLPQNISTVEGALVEPLSVGFHAAEQANAKVGESAIILGAGPIGCMTLLALKSRGVSDITVTDVNAKRLDLAQRLGATRTIRADIDDVTKILGERGADMVFETAGTSQTTQQTVQLVRRGGTIVLVGMPMRDTPFDFGLLIAKEASIKTVFRYRHAYPRVIRALAEQPALVQSLRSMLSHWYTFDQSKEAFDFCSKNKLEVTKGIIEM